jgi:hypothetical protein
MEKNMSITDDIKSVAKLAKDYKDFENKVRIRLGWYINVVRPEVIQSLWAKELERRGNGLVIRKPVFCKA